MIRKMKEEDLQQCGVISGGPFPVSMDLRRKREKHLD